MMGNWSDSTVQDVFLFSLKTWVKITGSLSSFLIFFQKLFDLNVTCVFHKAYI